MLGYFTQEGYMYIISEYIDGIELDEYIRDKGASEAQVCELTR